MKSNFNPTNESIKTLDLTSQGDLNHFTFSYRNNVAKQFDTDLTSVVLAGSAAIAVIVAVFSALLLRF